MIPEDLVNAYCDCLNENWEALGKSGCMLVGHNGGVFAIFAGGVVKRAVWDRENDEVAGYVDATPEEIEGLRRKYGQETES